MVLITPAVWVIGLGNTNRIYQAYSNLFGREGRNEMIVLAGIMNIMKIYSITVYAN